MKRLILLGTVILSACSNLIIDESKIETYSIAEAESMIDDIIEEYNLVGIGASVLSRDEVYWSQGFGYASVENGDPFTIQTTMNIASITKTVTSTSMLMLVDRGLCNLEDDINDYLPFDVVNPHYPESKIEIRDVLTHRSGIWDRGDYYNAAYLEIDQPFDLGKYLEDFLDPNGPEYGDDNFLPFKSGEKYSYSNIGAGLVGYLIEQISGYPLNEFTRLNIFDTLGMDHSFWFFDEPTAVPHATLYEREGNINVPRSHYQLITYADGGLRTCVQDLSIFFRCILRNGNYQGIQLVSSSLIEQMRSTYLEENELVYGLTNSGLYWEIGPQVEGHSGGDPGVSTWMYYDRERDIGVILFANSEVPGIKPMLDIWDILWNMKF